jgi:hypothetical protein
MQLKSIVNRAIYREKSKNIYDPSDIDMVDRLTG